MKNYVIKTSCDETIGKGATLEDAVKDALHHISVEDFIEYCTYCEETTENIECYSCLELYGMANELVPIPVFNDKCKHVGYKFI